MKKVEGEKPRGVETATPFHCSTPVQIRYTDLDLQGHVNNSVYLNFFDLAKIDYFNRVKGGNVDWENANVVIAGMKIDFMQPTLFVDTVAVETQTVRLGNKSVTLLQQLINTENHELKCQCVTTMVLPGF